MVRAAPDKERVRTVRLSLASTAGAGLIILALWWALRAPRIPTAQLRLLTDTTVEWVCADNPTHRFQAPGRYEPLPCRTCGARCFVLLDYQCPQHGRFQVLAQFERLADPADGTQPARERVSLYRYLPLEGSDWRTSVDGAVPCPAGGCGLPAQPIRPTWSAPRHPPH